MPPPPPASSAPAAAAATTTPTTATLPLPLPPKSILDDLGEDLTGVATPVAICMAVTVALCRALNPDGASDPGVVRMASLAYEEKAGDAAATKFGGGLLNALIFVAIMAAMTFGLFVLFKLRCYRVIGAYMGFSLFNIFFLLTGAVLVSLARATGVPVDAPSLLLFLLNLAAVGTAATFFLPAPLALRQALLVWVGVVMAYVFSLVPEWTTWCLLAAMAVYDLAAVLLPGGPLKIMVELAVERQVELPALVYESRPSGGRAYARGAWMRRRGRGGGGVEAGAAAAAAAAGPQADAAAEAAEAGAAMATAPQPGRRRWWRPSAAAAAGAAGAAQRRDASPSARVALLASASELGLSESPSYASRRQQMGEGGSSGAAAAAAGEAAATASAGAAAALGPDPAAPPAPVGDGANPPARASDASGSSRDDDDDPSAPSGGMLLGMGDFIFYGALVGRAAGYDLATVCAAFVAVLAGLVVTLLSLSLGVRALPALPVSIALGTAYCFWARWALEPVAVPLTVNGAWF
jgi:presenilin 1